MSHQNPLADSVTHSERWIAGRKSTWLPPTILCGLLAVTYALTMTRLWDASQAVAVRQDASASVGHPGKFADLYEMRTVQETILELARSQQVIAATMQKFAGAGTEQPSAEAIDKFRERLRMSPPGGAEFGKTEVFYLSVKDPSRERALQLVGELCQQLDLRLRELRGDQASGLINETQAQLDASEQLLTAETHRLADFEAEVGADLGELRMLNSSLSGQSDLRQKYVALEADCRRFKEAVRETTELLDLVGTENVDATRLAALPNSLLTAQPALRQLKDGLVGAQLQTARLQGVRSAAHPRVQAAAEAEASMRRDLADEMEAARHAAEAELRLRESRYAAALGQLQQVEHRLAELAEKRAEYSNRISALESSRDSVDRLRQRLAASQASEAAAKTSSVLNLVDKPETGPSPDGPSRAMIVLAGFAGGLVIGVGLVVCQMPPSDDVDNARNRKTEEATDATSEASAPEWWELPSETFGEEQSALSMAPQREPVEVVQVESVHAQPSVVIAGVDPMAAFAADAEVEVAEIEVAEVEVAEVEVAEVEVAEVEVAEVEVAEVEVAEVAFVANEAAAEEPTNDSIAETADETTEQIVVATADESEQVDVSSNDESHGAASLAGLFADAPEEADEASSEDGPVVDDLSANVELPDSESDATEDSAQTDADADADADQEAWEAPIDLEIEEEADELKRQTEALEQDAAQRETTTAPVVSPSAPTRTTMPTISLNDESLQEAMRQAFTK
ncbi:hypothetical protein OAS39_00515 [Pirellulales bacterium]|nr:hypothetical protein [Pirellulales bacterium]